MPETIETAEPRTFTFVVPVRTLEHVPACLASIARVRYPHARIEVIVACGDQPSLQRNVACAQARGDYIYFVDDDSQVEAHAPARVDESFREDDAIGGVGGPSVVPPGQPVRTRSFAIAMGSAFGLGPARQRYFPSGLPRPAGENELILCNMALRADAWRRHEGFDPRLHPNEENELVNRLGARGVAFLYHPGVIVFRPPRTTLAALALQVFRYGSSRMSHFRLRPDFINVVYFFPMALVAYLLTIAVLSLACPHVLGRWPAVLAPAAVYAQMLVAASLFGGLSLRRGRALAALWLLLVFPTIHLGYGAGMWAGRLVRPRAVRAPRPIAVVRWKALGAPSFPSTDGDWAAGAERIA